MTAGEAKRIANEYWENSIPFLLANLLTIIHKEALEGNYETEVYNLSDKEIRALGEAGYTVIRAGVKSGKISYNIRW